MLSCNYGVSSRLHVPDPRLVLPLRCGTTVRCMRCRRAPGHQRSWRKARHIAALPCVLCAARVDWPLSLQQQTWLGRIVVLPCGAGVSGDVAVAAVVNGQTRDLDRPVTADDWAVAQRSGADAIDIQLVLAGSPEGRQVGGGRRGRYAVHDVGHVASLG